LAELLRICQFSAKFAFFELAFAVLSAFALASGPFHLKVKLTTIREINVYKNLNSDLLAISGRQSEIIELALTYGFRGIDIDMVDLVKRCGRSSFESSARFLVSSKLKIGGFETPIDLDCDDETYATKLAALNGVAEIAGRAGAHTTYLILPTGTNRLPYPEYFDVIRKRIDEIAAIFAKEDIKLAIGFNAIPGPEEKQFKFVRDVEGFLASVRSCTSKNVYIIFDSWNWHLGGGTEAKLDELGVERVAMLRLADCKENVDAAAATQDDCLLPSSTGVIDCVAYLKKFADIEAKLPVSAMGKPLNQTPTRDALVGLTQDALDKTFSEAGLPSHTRKPDTFVEQSYARNYD
jgi:sugar phosphate isomerase/epimerase